MKTLKKPVSNNLEHVESSKIDAIKDILFGDDIQTYDNEFKHIKKEILERKNELLSIIEETRKELDTAIDSLSTDINIRITSVEDNLNEKINDLDTNKVNKSTLGKLLIQLGEKISD